MLALHALFTSFLLFSDNTSIHQEKMRSYFSRQLLFECTITDRRYPVTCSVGIMLHCLAAYDSREDKRTRSQENYALNTLQHCTAEIISWMDVWSYNWQTYMDTILEVHAHKSNKYKVALVTAQVSLLL